MRSSRAVIRSSWHAALGLLAVVLLAAGPVGGLSLSVFGAEGDRPGPANRFGGGLERAADSFRVQVYATTERSAAESFRSEVRRWWSEVEGEAPRDVFGESPVLTIEQAGKYYRVQIGTFSTRRQAERAQTFLSEQYPDAFVVRGPPSSSAGMAPAGSSNVEKAPTGDHYRVQLFATTERSAAESFRSEVRRWWSEVEGEAPRDVFGESPVLTIEQAGKYYRVQMGTFSTRRQAERAQTFLSEQYPNAFVAHFQAEQQKSGEPEGRQADRAEADAQDRPSRSERTGMQRSVDSTTITPAAIWAQIQRSAELVENLSQDSIYTKGDIAEFFAVGCALPSPEEARANALAREASHSRRNYGVELEARYGQRTTAIADDFSGSLSGTFVGLNWDLLSQGLIGNRQQGNLLEARAEAERITGRLARIQRTETCRARRIQERIRALIPKLLEAKIELGTHRKRLLRQAYLEGEALLDTFLDSKRSVREAERRLEILRDTVRGENRPAPPEAFPPLLRFEFGRLAQSTLGDSLLHRLGRMERRAISQQDRAAFDTRLGVFGRYVTTRSLDDPDFEFGLRFSQPLFGALIGNDGVAEEQRIELRRREEELALMEREENLNTVRRRFEEDQARAIRAHYRTASRRERVRRRLSERSIRANDRLNEALQDAQDLLNAAIEKALAYGEVYEEVARAFGAAREPFNPTYLDVHPVTDYEWRGRAGRRALYVWSGAYRTHSNDFLIELARARKIERLVVSAGRDTPMEKLRELQARAQENDLSIELLLAPNHWVRPGGVERAKTRIENLDLRGDALHLDVEPHMFDDFDQRQDELLRRYLEVLRVARRTIGNNELVVSIPLFWPDRVYQEIAKIVDRVHLMAYGKKKTHERASQILEVARHFAPEQRVVALRPEDFANPWKLDQSISTLQKVVETNRFALHDLESFLQFIRDEP